MTDQAQDVFKDINIPGLVRKPKVKETTVGERGALLPHGVFASGGLSTAFSVKTWKTKDERELAQKTSELKGANMASYVATVLSTMCTQIGPHNFLTMTEDQRRLAVSKMTMPDVLYSYVWLRIKAMSSLLTTTLRSPVTKSEFVWTADLSTTKVKYVDKEEDAEWEYELQDPFEMRGKRVTRLVGGPSRWYDIESIDDANAAAGKVQAVKAHVRLAPDLSPEPMAFVVEDFDEMGKRDLEALAYLINEFGIGCDMTMEVMDPKKNKFTVPLDWRYESFFGSSSR